MAEGNTSQGVHITELDFDISKVPAQLLDLEKQIENGSKRLRNKINQNMGIDLNIKGSTTKAEKEIDVFGQRVSVSLKKAKETMRKQGDIGMGIVDYLRNGKSNGKTPAKWDELLEMDFGKGQSNLKKSLSSYIEWTKDSAASGMDTLAAELNNIFGNFAKNYGDSIQDQAQAIDDQINKYRSKLTKITRGAFNNEEIDTLYQKRYSMTENDEMTEVIEAMYHKQAEAIKEGTKEVEQAYKLGDRSGVGYDELEKRMNKIASMGGVEKKTSILSDGDNQILRATIEYTDQLGQNWREILGWVDETGKETKETAVAFQTISHLDVDEPIKRAKLAMDELQKSFKAYATLRTQVETGNLGGQEQVVMQERLNEAHKKYEDSISKVVTLSHSQNVDAKSFENVLIKEKELQEDIAIAIEKQNVARQDKTNASFAKESSELTSSLLAMEKTAKDIGLSPQFTEQTTRIRTDIEKMAKTNPVITQQEQDQLKFLAMQSAELKEQLTYEKQKFDDNKKYKSELKEINNLIEKQKDFSQRQSVSKSPNMAIKNQSNEYILQLETLKQQLVLNKKLEQSEKDKLDDIIANTKELNRQAMVKPPVAQESFLSQTIDKVRWTAAFRVTQLAEQGLRETLKTLKEVEFGVMEVTRVLNEASLDVQGFTTNIFNLAGAYGQTFENTRESILRLAQAGYSSAEALKMTETTMLALNTAELNSEQATNSLIGIMKQWGIQVEEFPLLIDKINYAADNYAVTSQDLVDGLLRTSSSAKNAKISFDDTVGALVLMREESGRTGKEVGNAFNSLINYTRRAQSLNVFEGLGIKVYADEAKTSLVPLLDMWKQLSDLVQKGGSNVITTLTNQTDMSSLLSEEVARATDTLDEYNQALEEETQWNAQGLDDMKKKSLYTQAGTHRQNYFIALLNNFNKVQEVSTDLQNAEGHSMRENAKYMETLTAKYNQFITALQSVAVEAGEAGLLGFAKNILDIGTALTNGSKGLKNWPVLIAAMTIAFSLFNKQYKLFGSGTKTLEQMQASFAKFGTVVKGILSGTGTQMVLTTAKTIGLKLAIAGLQAVATFGLSIALSVLVDILANLALGVSSTSEKFEEATEKIKETTREVNKNVGSLSEMKERYAELSQGVMRNGENFKLSSEDFKEYNGMQRQLAELFPELVNGLDKEGNEIITLTGNVQDITVQIDELIKKMREFANIKILDNSKDVFKGIKDNIDNYQKELSELESQREKVHTKSIWANDLLEVLEYEKMLTELGYNIDEIKTKSNERVGLSSGIMYTYDLTNVKEFDKEIERSTANNVAKQKRAADAIDKEYRKLNPIIIAKLELDYQYNELTPKLQEFAQTVAQNMQFKDEESLTKWVETFITDLKESKPEVIAAVESLTNFEESFLKGELTVEQYNAKIVAAFKILKDLLQDELIPQEAFGRMEAGFLKPILAIQALGEEMTKAEALTKKLLETHGTLEEHLKKTNATVDGLQSAYGILTKAVTEFNSAEGMSLDTIQSLLSLDSQYLALLINEDGQFAINEESLKNLTLAKIDELEITALRQAQNMIASLENEAAAQDFLKNKMKATATEARTLNAEILNMISTMAFSEGTTKAFEQYLANIGKTFGALRGTIGNSGFDKVLSSSKTSGGSSGGGVSKSWYDAQVEYFERLNSMGQYNEKQVVEFYRSMTKNANLSSAERIKAEDKLFSAIKKEIQESLKLQLKSLDTQKKAIEKAHKVNIDGLKAEKEQIENNADKELERINRVEKEKDRAREREEYYRNRSTILSDIESAKERSGLEARRAEKEAQEKLTNLDKDYNDKLDQQGVEDRKAQIEANKQAQLDSIDAQIEALDKLNEASLESIENQITKLNEKFNEESINMLAYSAMNSEALYNQYVDGFIEPMVNGLLDGFTQANDLMLTGSYTNANAMRLAYENNFIAPLKTQINNLLQSGSIGTPTIKPNSNKAGPEDYYELNKRMTGTSGNTNNRSIVNNFEMNNTVSDGADWQKVRTDFERSLSDTYYNLN